MGIVLVIGLLSYNEHFFGYPGIYLRKLPWLQTLLVRIPWSIIIDYISLYKTRIVLRILTHSRRMTKLVSVGVLSMDYLVYRILFYCGFSVTLYILWMLYVGIHNIGEILAAIRDFPTLGLHWSFVAFLLLEPVPRKIGTLFYIFFWSGFAPSLWMWLYVLALFVTRGLLRSEKLVNWLRWFLDVEKTPFRSIGAVAATLAFIASVAIIAVSAEVSRISGA
jgi:hypothetical protein